MPQTLFTSRSAVLCYQRCRRLRYLEYYAGPEGIGLQPARKSSHLVVGGAVHAGLEVLLREGQRWLDRNLHCLEAGKVATLDEQLEFLFVQSRGLADGKTVARQIEDAAVGAALVEFEKEWAEGVEMDPEEARQRAGTAGEVEVVNDLADLVGKPAGAAALGTQESPIVIEFDLAPGGGMGTRPMLPDGSGSLPPGDHHATFQPKPFDQDQWLKEEMAALVEGMVRCWARRRWRGVLAEFEVLEVEQEGEWKLAEWSDGRESWNGATNDWNNDSEKTELHFLSRHDALLLERSTGYLYLQSFKTTGAWDRRKELDAQVDMQGLSEAVDVERRFGEAWRLVQEESNADGGLAAAKRLTELVSPRIAQWLSTLPDPPTILGVRYDYLLKGSRKDNKKAGPGEPRWNQESILVRAYSQEGITSEDRRWAWTYEWKDQGGKGRRLDYRSWAKQPVWRSMPIADWIDLLDQGKVQEDALGEDGEALDPLAVQLVPVLVQYRNQDDALDWLEQTEAQERQVALDVEAVRRAEREGGWAAKRSSLNRLFPMTRTACSYPGVCQFRSLPTQPGICFGAPGAEEDPAVLANFRARVPNHPKEGEGLVQIGEQAGGAECQ